MSVDQVRVIIRLFALATVLVGAVMTTMTLIGVVAWGQATISVSDQEWSGAGMDAYAIAAHASIIAWGVGFHLASGRLAKLVVK
ncbi:MAG: hypothetical protein ACE37K_19435 [Planctomycetota bacterium]